MAQHKKGFIFLEVIASIFIIEAVLLPIYFYFRTSTVLMIKHNEREEAFSIAQNYLGILDTLAPDASFQTPDKKFMVTKHELALKNPQGFRQIELVVKKPQAKQSLANLVVYE